MKILFISPYPPRKDGIGDYTSRFVDSIKKLNEEVFVIAPKSPKEKSEGKVYRVLGSSRADIKRTLDVINQIRPDVIHVQYCIASYGLGFIAIMRILRKIKTQAPTVKRLITLHEVQREHKKLNIFARIFYRIFLRFFDGFIVHTISAKNTLRNVYNLPSESIKVINFPVIALPTQVPDAKLDALNKKYSLQGKFVILCFGFIQIDKGIDDLVNALHQLNKHPELKSKLHVLIAGDIRSRSGIFRFFEHKDKEYLRTIKAFVKDHGLENQVTFTGYVDRKDVPIFFSRADVITIPYTSIEQSSVLGIALTAHRPIIATNVGGLGETLRDAGILVETHNSAQLAKALKNVYAYPENNKRLLDNYERLARASSQTAVSKDTLKFYHAQMRLRR